jgi:hypothetical protein
VQYFRIVDSKTAEITLKLAKEFAAMSATVTERDLDPRRMKYLHECITSGKAISFNWSKAIVNGTTAPIRINGNHSSHVLADMNGQFPAGLKVHIDTYEVEKEEYLPQLFKQFDSRKSTRTLSDICSAYQMSVPALRQLTKSAARKAIEGLGWYERKIVGSNPPIGDDIYDLFFDKAHHPFLLMACPIVSVKTPEFSIPVMGAMYGSYGTSPQNAETFWGLVAHEGGGENATHPATVLDQWLVAAHTAEQKPPQLEVYRACAIAWNRYRNQQPLDRIGKFDPRKGYPDLE